MKKHIPIEDGDYYLTPEGYRCFTTQYHLKRGYCCESGCKHCPYGYNTRTNTQNLTKQELKIFNQLQFIFVEYLYNPRHEPIDMKELYTDLKILGDLIMIQN